MTFQQEFFQAQLKKTTETATAELETLRFERETKSSEKNLYYTIIALKKARVQREGGKPSIEAREVERRPQEAQGGHGEYNTPSPLPPAPPKKVHQKVISCKHWH